MTVAFPLRDFSAPFSSAGLVYDIPLCRQRRPSLLWGSIQPDVRGQLSAASGPSYSFGLGGPRSLVLLFLVDFMLTSGCEQLVSSEPEKGCSPGCSPGPGVCSLWAGWGLGGRKGLLLNLNLPLQGEEIKERSCCCLVIVWRFMGAETVQS